MPHSRPRPENSGASRRVLVGLMAATGVFTLGEGAFNVLLAPHLQGQGLSQATIGVVVATFSVAALVGRPLVGSLYRPDRGAGIVAGGCALSALAYLAISGAADPWLLAALLAGHGTGIALSTTGGLAAVMDVSGDRTAGAVMGWYTGAIGLGYAFAAFVGGAAGDALGTAGAITIIAAVPVLAGLLLGGMLHSALGGRARSNVRRGDGGPSGSEGATGRSPTTTSPPRPAAADATPSGPGGPLSRAGLRGAPSLVWLAFAVALHINLLNGLLTTYFPLYGLAIGLSLTRIGVLLGLHSVVSAAVRFLAPAIFRRIEPRRLMPWLVSLGGASVAALTIRPDFAVLSLIWMLIGLARGVLRVSSAALVMEATSAHDGRRGVGSGIYLAGLDVGKIIGPLVGGVVVQVWGFAVAFLLAGLGFPVVYAVLSRRVAGRERRAHAGSGNGSTDAVE